MHWADDGLLHFVDYLAGWAEGPILIVALARPEIIDRRPGWAGAPDVMSATLQPLGLGDQETMLDNLLPHPLPRDLKNLVMERSGGNPLFNEEIVRMLIDRELLVSREGGWTLARAIHEIDVPRSIHALIAARLDALPKEEKVVLQDAAVVGRYFWPSGVARIAATPVDETSEIFARLRAKELVVPNRPSSFSGEPEFAFHHVLIRDVAYESLPKSARAAKHVVAAMWAIDRAGDRKEEFAELIATHYAAATDYLEEIRGPTAVDRDLATSVFQWALAAGRRAEKLWQMSAAVNWYERALSLGEKLTIGVGDMAEIAESSARASFGVEPAESVAERYETALRLYREVERDEDAGRVLVSLAWLDFQRARDEHILPRLTEALELLEPGGDSRDLALALNRLGWYLWRRARQGEAEELLRRATAIAARVGDTAIRADSLHTLGVMDVWNGSPEGLPLIEESYELACTCDNVDIRLRVTANLISILAELAPNGPRCKRLFDEGMEIARKAGNKPGEAWIAGNYAAVAEYEGKLEEALALYDDYAECARAVDDMPTYHFALRDQAWLKTVQGDIDAAEPLFRAAQRFFEGNVESQAVLMMEALEGTLLGARGDHEAALACLRAAVEAQDERVLEGGGAHLLIHVLRRLAREGEFEAGRWHRENLANAAAAGYPTYQALLKWLDGLLEEDPARAVKLLEEAVLALDELGWRVDKGKCMVDLARAQRNAGMDPEPAARSAQELLESCGAYLFAQEAAELVG